MDSIIKHFFWKDLNHTIVCGDHNLGQLDLVLAIYYSTHNSFSLDGRYNFPLSEKSLQVAKECALLVVNDLPTMEMNTDFVKVLEILEYRVEHQGKILFAGDLEYFRSSKEAVIQKIYSEACIINLSLGGVTVDQHEMRRIDFTRPITIEGGKEEMITSCYLLEKDMEAFFSRTDISGFLENTCNIQSLSNDEEGNPLLTGFCKISTAFVFFSSIHVTLLEAPIVQKLTSFLKKLYLEHPSATVFFHFYEKN